MAGGGAAGRELPTSPGGRGGLRLRREQLCVADRVGGERKRGLDLVRVRDRDRDRDRVRVRVRVGVKVGVGVRVTVIALTCGSESS